MKILNELENLPHVCYIITNIKNNKVYIGVTHKTIDLRLKEHIKAARLKNNKKYAINKAIIKHGSENFIITALSECSSRAEAFAKETFFIKKYNSNNKDYGYNETKGGDGGPAILKLSTELINLVLQDYCDGCSTNQISKKYNISKYCVFDITRLRLSDIHNISKELIQKVNYLKEKSKKQKRMTCELLEQIMLDYCLGSTFSQLSIRYNFSIGTIYSALTGKTHLKIKINPSLKKKVNRLIFKRGKQL